MGWISLQRQWGLNTAQGEKTGSGEESRGFPTWALSVPVSLSPLPVAGCPCTYLRAAPGWETGSCCLCPATDPEPGLSEPALGKLDALGLLPAALQDAWWGCGVGFALETVCQFILDFCKWG